MTTSTWCQIHTCSPPYSSTFQPTAILPFLLSLPHQLLTVTGPSYHYWTGWPFKPLQVDAFPDSQSGFNRDNLVFMNIPQPCGHECTFNRNIKLAVLKVCSLLNKYLIINDLILDSKLDGILSTETLLGTEAPVVLTEVCPPNFNFLFSIRGDESRWDFNYFE